MKSKRRTTTWALLVGICAMIALSACGGSDSTSDSATSDTVPADNSSDEEVSTDEEASTDEAPDEEVSTDEAPDEGPSEPVDLRMAVWTGNEAYHELFNSIGDAYVAEHSDTVSSVTFETIPFGDYIAGLTTQIAGGDSPDLAWVFEVNAQEFVQTDVLANLTPTFAAEDGWNLDDLLPGAIETWSKEGNLYAYPFSNNPHGIFVNLDLIEAAGQPNPRDLLESGDWTFDAMMEIAVATSESQSTAGLDLQGYPYERWNDSLSAMWPAWGAYPWSEDGSECTFTSPEMIEFLTWFHSQAFDANATPLPGEVVDFASGQAVFRLGYASVSAQLESITWDYLPMPAGPAGAAAVTGQAGVGVIERGPNPDIALDFLAYFTNPENAKRLAAFFPPPRESLLTVDVLSEAIPALTPVQLQTGVIDQALEGSGKLGHPKMSSVLDRVRSGLDSLWVEDADVAEVVAQICGDIDQYMVAGG